MHVSMLNAVDWRTLLMADICTLVCYACGGDLGKAGWGGERMTECFEMGEGGLLVGFGITSFSCV